MIKLGIDGMVVEFWIISGLLSLWYFVRASKYYPDIYEWKGMHEMDIGDLFVMIAIIIGGSITLAFVILILCIKIRTFKLFK